MEKSITLYRGTYIDENFNNIGNWYANNLDSARRYSSGKIIKIKIILNTEEEGRYMLTSEVRAYGHHKTYGVWKKTETNTWYYISPEYLLKNIINMEEILL